MSTAAPRIYLSVDAQKCVNCHQCISACPVKYCNDGSGDHIAINHDLCILCGNCVKACPHDARRVKDDLDEALAALARGEKFCAIVAPAAASSFGADALRVNGWLAQLGVRAVFDVSFGADLTGRSYAEHIRSHDPACVIAQPCPVIVKYIQLYQPELLPYLAPVDSPMGHTVKMIRAQYPEYDDHGILVVSPCMAKAQEFAEWGVEVLNITVASVQRHLQATGDCLQSFPERAFDGPIPERGVCFPMPGGLLATVQRELPGIEQRTRRIEGPRVFEYLKSLSASISAGEAPLLIDCLNCEAGCIGGPGTTDFNHPNIDRLETAIRARKARMIEHYRSAGGSTAAADPVAELRAIIDAHWSAGHYQRTYCDQSEITRSAIRKPSEAERTRILRAMRKYDASDMRNCSACGYNSCEAMVEAIHNGLNRVENCYVFLQKEAEEQLLDELLVGVLLIDPETHTIIRANDKAAEMVGMPADEIIGRSCHRFVCPATEGRCPITDMGKSIDESERILLTTGAREIPVLKSVRRITMYGKELLLESFVDITEQHQLRVSNEQAIRALEKNGKELLGMMKAAESARASATAERGRLEHVIAATHAGTWEWNVQTGATMFNETWAELCGYTLKELEPVSIETWKRLTHPDDLTRSHAMLNQHFAGETEYYECECRMRHKNGHWVWVQDRGKLISRTDDGKPLLMFGTHIDVTARKEAEQELNALNGALTGREERIVQMKQEVNALLRECNLPLRYTATDPTDPDGLSETSCPLADATSVADLPFAELVDVKALEVLLKTFCEATGVAAAVEDMNGVVLASANWKRVCTDFHRRHEVTALRCVDSDREMAARVSRGQGHVLYQCRNGLMDAGSPIYIDGRHVGNAFIGQFLLAEPDYEQFRRQARAFNFDEERYIAALDELPRIPAEKLPGILASLMGLTTVAAAMGMERLRSREAATSLERSQQRLLSQRRAALSLFEDAERAKTDLAQANCRLEEQTARASELAARAEMASAAKSEFLANMSHEIRTPMTAILGFAETAIEGCPFHRDPAAGECHDQLQTIMRNGKYLLQIINDILDLSKIEAGKLIVERVRCAPCQIVAEVESLVRVRSAARGLDLRIQYEGGIPESVLSDPTRLRQILINLLGNAIKFTELGHVALVTRLAHFPDGSPALQFDVIDTGAGMTDEQATRLFKPFSQADASTTRKFGGTGLGLAISRRLAQALGGDVELVETTPGAGSRFRVTIATGALEGVRMLQYPAVAHRVAPQKQGEIATDPGRLACHVLLAEDGPDNRRLITHVLKKAGATVTVVENGQLAVDAALPAPATTDGDAPPPFDVILMDMQMPVMDGYTATSTLRARGYTGPIIALTAHAMASDRQKCLDAGCDDYASKPIDRNELIEAIRRAIATAGGRRARVQEER